MSDLCLYKLPLTAIIALIIQNFFSLPFNVLYSSLFINPTFHAHKLFFSRHADVSSKIKTKEILHANIYYIYWILSIVSLYYLICVTHYNTQTFSCQKDQTILYLFYIYRKINEMEMEMHCEFCYQFDDNQILCEANATNSISFSLWFNKML